MCIRDRNICFVRNLIPSTSCKFHHYDIQGLRTNDIHSEMHPLHDDECFTVTRPAIHVCCKTFAHVQEKLQKNQVTGGQNTTPTVLHCVSKNDTDVA